MLSNTGFPALASHNPFLVNSAAASARMIKIDKSGGEGPRAWGRTVQGGPNRFPVMFIKMAQGKELEVIALQELPQAAVILPVHQAPQPPPRCSSMTADVAPGSTIAGGPGPRYPPLGALVARGGLGALHPGGALVAVDGERRQLPAPQGLGPALHPELAAVGELQQVADLDGVVVQHRHRARPGLGQTWP